MKGRVEEIRFKSRLLENNPLQDPVERSVYVYLPPQYDMEARRFPTIMLLPGFGSSHRSLLGFDPWKPNPCEAFDALVAQGQSRPALLVLPDATTRWGGSQYLDSPALGPYQSYLADEVTHEVDARYRTIAEPEGRGVVGRSSGGFGALRLGMDRPDRFSAVGSHAGDAAFELSMPPMFVGACIAFAREGGVAAFAIRLQREGPQDQASFEAALVLTCAGAYSPEPDAPWPHIRLPFDLGTAARIGEVWNRWLSHDPLVRMRKDVAGLGSARRVYLDAGDADEHGLQFAARQMATELQRHHVHVKHAEHPGRHRGTRWRYSVSLPSLVEVLEPR